jgi:SAM-dependent methyltransferase
MGNGPCPGRGALTTTSGFRWKKPRARIAGMASIDPGRSIDWGRTSSDYAEFRPGPPASFYERLRALGVGIAGQRILDLGTGTGVLAREFALAGCHAAGVDISVEQIEAARALALGDGLRVEFRVAPAEDTGLPVASFDVVTANQCWLYFDRDRVVAEVKRLLAQNGVLVISHFTYLPRLDPIARRTEEIVLRFNPQWTAADWSGDVPAIPRWVRGDFTLAGSFVYDEVIPFTREGWRGRMRACRGVGAALSPAEIERFDQEHATMLSASAPERFNVMHRLHAHVLRPAP